MSQAATFILKNCFKTQQVAFLLIKKQVLCNSMKKIITPVFLFCLFTSKHYKVVPTQKKTPDFAEYMSCYLVQVLVQGCLEGNKHNIQCRQLFQKMLPY